MAGLPLRFASRARRLRAARKGLTFNANPTACYGVGVYDNATVNIYDSVVHNFLQGTKDYAGVYMELGTVNLYNNTIFGNRTASFCVVIIISACRFLLRLITLMISCWVNR